MARADRLERADRLRDMLEGEYRAHLVVALQNTAAGHWGLFDHQQDRTIRAKIAPTIARLTELAEEIDEQRELLGLEPFALHEQFIAARGPVRSNAVGEPKQAKAWLERLGEPVWPKPA
ncbi:MAG: hypothetical protein KGL44_08880 [Sphingomonadales bacterium]|nr:hypothetical protein [Sphingomonadales bacterium]